MQKRVYKIITQEGIHARSATALVNCAMKHECDVYLMVQNKKVNLKSILGVLSLGLYYGDSITITADGKGEEEIMTQLDQLMFTLSLGKKQ